MSACDLEAMFYERRLYGLFLLDNTARGLLYKSQNVFDFGRHRDLVTNFLQAFGAKFSALVEQAVGFVNVVNEWLAESVALETDNVQSAERGGCLVRYVSHR